MKEKQMKTKMQLLAVIAAILTPVLQMHPQGYIVPNGVTSQYSGNQFNLFVIQNPTNGNYSGFALDSQTANSFLYNPILDGAVRTFFVSFNSPITQQAISANSYSELTYPNIYTFANGSPFYVGLYVSGQDFPQNGIYSDPSFGWARLVNNNGTISLLDSALAYKSQGIFAGTQNLIPEPSGLGLLGLGALIFGWRRHGRRNAQT